MRPFRKTLRVDEREKAPHRLSMQPPQELAANPKSLLLTMPRGACILANKITRWSAQLSGFRVTPPQHVLQPNRCKNRTACSGRAGYAKGTETHSHTYRRCPRTRRGVGVTDLRRIKSHTGPTHYYTSNRMCRHESAVSRDAREKTSI